MHLFTVEYFDRLRAWKRVNFDIENSALPVVGIQYDYVGPTNLLSFDKDRLRGYWPDIDQTVIPNNDGFDFRLQFNPLHKAWHYCNKRSNTFLLLLRPTYQLLRDVFGTRRFLCEGR